MFQYVDPQPIVLIDQIFWPNNSAEGSANGSSRGIAPNAACPLAARMGTIQCDGYSAAGASPDVVSASFISA